jgi:hypothetical protein
MNNEDVVGHWVRQSKPRAKGHNVSFEGDKLYSYWTLIARRFETPKGVCLLVTNRRYGPTTDKQIRYIGWDHPRFNVPDLDVLWGHQKNLAFFKTELITLKVSLEARRMSSARLSDRRQIDDLKDKVRRYCDQFDLELPEEFEDVSAYLAENLSAKTLVKLVQDRLAA